MGAWENRYGVVNPEELEKCLECPYPDCINCMATKTKGARNRRFTDGEILVLKDTSKSDIEVAEILGRTKASIVSKRAELNIKRGRKDYKSKYNWSEHDNWVILHNTPSDIADLLGLPLGVIEARRRYLIRKERMKKWQGVVSIQSQSLDKD